MQKPLHLEVVQTVDKDRYKEKPKPFKGGIWLFISSICDTKHIFSF